MINEFSTVLSSAISAELSKKEGTVAIGNGRSRSTDVCIADIYFCNTTSTQLDPYSGAYSQWIHS